MMRRIRISLFPLLAFGGALALAACGTPTPYQPAADGHGYAEQPIEDDRYRVTFSGNSLTPRETVENYLLYRAAEVTVERGYDHFVVVEKDTERSTTYRSTVSGFGGHQGIHGFHHGRHRGFGGFASGTTWPRDRYTGFANIVMREGETPEDAPDAYDAREVLKRLAPTVARRPSS
jgi:hypothetical protein